MGTMMQKVVSHVTGQKTSGQNTLALAVETIDHFAGESGDWSPLAYLIGRSEPVQSRQVRLIARNVIQGWALVKDGEQNSGLRFKKQKGKNQGFDGEALDKVRALAGQKVSIQSPKVKALFEPEETAPTPFDPKAKAERWVKANKDVDRADMMAFIHALQEELKQKA